MRKISCDAMLLSCTKNDRWLCDSVNKCSFLFLSSDVVLNGFLCVEQTSEITLIKRWIKYLSRISLPPFLSEQDTLVHIVSIACIRVLNLSLRNENSEFESAQSTSTYYVTTSYCIILLTASSSSSSSSIVETVTVLYFPAS